MSSFPKKMRRLMECRHRLFELPGFRYLSRYLDQPAYWAINRRKVALSVAIGLFCGVIPGPLKRLSAVFLTLLTRVNLLATLATSLYSNPLTIFPLYIVAYAYGQILLYGQFNGELPIPPNWSGISWSEWITKGIQWMMTLGRPLVLGALALGATLAIIGYCLTRLLWRCAVVNAWKKRAIYEQGHT